MFIIEKILRKNGKKFAPICELNEIADVIMYMDANGLKMESVPYIFTHINLSDGSRVREYVITGLGSHDRIITSPTALRQALISNRV